MDKSRFTAGVIGPVALALSASLLLNPGLLVDMAGFMASDPALIMLTGALIMVAGLAIVRGSVRVDLVRFIGLLFILLGIVRIVLVRQVAELTSQVAALPNAQIYAAALLGLIGLTFTYLGWFARPVAQPEA